MKRRRRQASIIGGGLTALALIGMILATVSNDSTPEPSPSPTPTVVATTSPTATSTATATRAPTPTRTPAPTETPSQTPVPPTRTATATPTATPATPVPESQQRCESGWLYIDGVKYLVYATPRPECRFWLFDEELPAPFDHRPDWWPHPPDYIIDFFTG